MTTPTSGAIAVSNVSTELGRSSTATTSLGESAVRALAGILLGPVALGDLYGKSNGGTLNPSASAMAPTSAIATLTFGTDGTITIAGSGTSNQTAYWYKPATSGIGSSYWLRVTVNSGSSLTGSSTGTWLQLSTSRSFNLTSSGNGVLSTNITIEIATDSGGSNIVASASATLSADSSY